MKFWYYRRTLFFFSETRYLSSEGKCTSEVYYLQVPLRAIYRAITKSNRAIYRAIFTNLITKIGNIEDLRGSQWVNVGHNNDINWSQ